MNIKAKFKRGTVIFILLFVIVLISWNMGFAQDAENSAPVLVPAAPEMTSINEDDIGNEGMTVSDIVGEMISDADVEAVEGIAVHSTDEGNGKWQYSIGDNPRWYEVKAVSEAEALLLGSSDRVRFVPNEKNGTNASFDYFAWDQTEGVPGDIADVSARGGITAFSMAEDRASILVTDVNDVPELASGFTEEPVTLWPRNYDHYGNNIEQRNPKITSNGSDFLLIWYEQFNISASTIHTETYVSRFSDTGVPIDPEGILAAKSGGYWNDEQYPAVCAVNDDYWIFYGVHLYGERIYNKVVTPGGDISERITVGQGQGLATIDSFKCAYMSNHNVIALWEQPAYPAKIVYSIITPERNIPVQDQFLVDGGDGGLSDVAASDSAFLVVYTDLDWGVGFRINAIRLDPNGNRLDTEPLLIGHYPAKTIDVISYLDGWLLVFDAWNYTLPLVGSLHGIYISADGTVSENLFQIDHHGRGFDVKIITTDSGFQLAISTSMTTVYNLNHDFEVLSQDTPTRVNTDSQLQIAGNDSGTTVAVWMKRQNFGSYGTGRLYGGPFDEEWAMIHLPDHYIDVNEAFSHTFPEDTFFDVDNGNTITYSAALEDDTALPVWLGFDPDTRTFSGTPGMADIGAVSVKVTATDNSAGSSSDVFKINVNSVMGDMNGDGIVDISDVIRVLRMALGLDDPVDCADINGDGIVDISDVILTLRMALGLDELQECI